MNYEKIVTLYDTAEHAEAAKRSLESAGFSPSEISMINSKTLSLAGEKLGEPGLWHRLFGRDIQQYEATVYGRSVEAGGVVLTVRVPESEAARATSILNAHRAIDLTKRAEQEGLLTASAAPRRRHQACPAVRPAPATMAAAGTIIRRRSARAGRGTNQRRQAPGPGGYHSNSAFRHGNTGGSPGDLA